ncbi:hypothetical protein ACERZ8_12985 [Tateyamaria armeniaca]|uniref:Major facilitator superfamily (MFS) profile domain-containing protein n=1 Tax=Tateyamaria armeniaca TaxID=2518930 RepID=A0ABW8UV28_9RHOB
MIMPIALAALFMGTLVGFVLARRFMLRSLVGLILVMIGLVFFVSWTPTEALPGDGYAIVIAAYLIAPPLAAGLFGGGVFAWLFRTRASAT